MSVTLSAAGVWAALESSLLVHGITDVVCLDNLGELCSMSCNCVRPIAGPR